MNGCQSTCYLPINAFMSSVNLQIWVVKISIWEHLDTEKLMFHNLILENRIVCIQCVF